MGVWVGYLRFKDAELKDAGSVVFSRWYRVLVFAHLRCRIQPGFGILLKVLVGAFSLLFQGNEKWIQV